MVKAKAIVVKRFGLAEAFFEEAYKKHTKAHNLSTPDFF